MKKPFLFITYFFLLFVFITFYFSLNKERVYNTENIIGKEIDKTELILFDNRKFSTSEISNYKYTLINFWASWCGPCRKEHKNLMRLSKNKNLKIIGVNFKDDQNKAKDFLAELGNPFYILTKDIDGKKSVDFGVYGIPETILVNQDLKILKKYIGPLSLKDTKEIIKVVDR
tara:strand:+ start:7420 stop:7935 length:516 start_codon:yes stop_codon:yes gene_type:complete